MTNYYKTTSPCDTTLLIGMEGGLVPGGHHLTMGVPVVLDEDTNKAINWYTCRSVPREVFNDPGEDIAQAITSWLCPVPVGRGSGYPDLEEPLDTEAWGPRIVAIRRGTLTYKALEGLGTDMPVITNRLPLPAGETPSEFIDVAYRLVRDLPAWSAAAYPRLVRMIVSEYFVPGQGEGDLVPDDFENLVHAALTVQVVKAAERGTSGWGVIPYALSVSRWESLQRDRVGLLQDMVAKARTGEELKDLRFHLEAWGKNRGG